MDDAASGCAWSMLEDPACSLLNHQLLHRAKRRSSRGTFWFWFFVKPPTTPQGKAPFESRDAQETYRKIKKDKPEFSGDVSMDAQHLIIQMLEKDPKQRLTLTQVQVGGSTFSVVDKRCTMMDLVRFFIIVLV